MKAVDTDTVNINDTRLGALIECCVTGQVGVVVQRWGARNLLAWVDDRSSRIYYDVDGYNNLGVIEVVP